ncbi:MAG: thioredoxin domain-containing protein [Nitrososphaerota archaeon]|nr:thioredoxin family protein [Candidatus Bathyarchaeota archaeon]MCX8161650.1 thioredoxin family protein [Candidatus Bathyarchaeota archaeon]MDW8061304.1 thioredoxin domain-containing protein [Nitrososphaerota archaeon]
MSNVLDVDAEDWEREVLRSDVLTIVDFWHERCPWCILLNPIFEEVAEEYRDRVKFVRFNVLKSSRNRDIAIRNGVMGTPTIAFYCNGRYLGSIVGFTPKTRLERIIKDFMEHYKECVKQSTKLE